VAIALVYSIKKPAVKVASAAVLASLSVIMQILPPLFVTPWFMRVDLVAVPWVLCWLLFGFDASLLSLLISVPLVGVLGPFAGGWVGAVMKSVASVWMFAVPAFFAWRMGGARSLILKKNVFVVASVVALVVRALVTVVFNFYFALPFFFSMTSNDIIQFFNFSQSFLGISLGLVGFGAFVGEVAFWNTAQGVIDIYAAYVIGFLVQRRMPVTAKE
jgi:riboflavin transporter FmnP